MGRTPDEGAELPKNDGTQKQRPARQPFDMWLEKQLHAMYDETKDDAEDLTTHPVEDKHKQRL